MEVRQDRAVAADGTRLALHRVGPAGATPVLFMPGTFSNHTFWLGTKGQGLAWAIADAGFEAVVLDPRGHGASDRPDGRDWAFEDWGRLDIPAALKAITADARPALMVGHSAGGASMFIALAGEPAMRERVAGLVALATPVPWLQRWHRVGARVIRAGSRLLGRFPARLLRMGPEDEMPGVMSQWMTWNLQGRWVGRDGVDYVTALGEVRIPVLAMSGAGDTVFAPPQACRSLVRMVGTADATYLLAGRKTGFSTDFGHAGIVVSRAAPQEIWPRVLAWLEAHSPAFPGGLPRE